MNNSVKPKNKKVKQVDLKNQSVGVEQPEQEQVMVKPTLTRQKAANKIVQEPELVEETKFQSKGEVKQVKKPRKASMWLIALKQYNSKQPSYSIPKKGTKEYDEVKKIEAVLKGN